MIETSENPIFTDKRKIILYIDTMYRGGAQRVMANLANYFSSNGVDVVLINDFPEARAGMVYSVNTSVKRIFLQESNKGNALIKNLVRILKLRKIIKQEQADTILSFMGPPNIRMLLATLGIRSSRKIVSVRNDPNKEYGTNVIIKYFVCQLFTFADGCVFQTEDAKQYFPKSVQNNSVVIFNPVDSKFYGIIRNTDCHNIITAGRLEAQKNHKNLITAFAQISVEFPEDKLIIYGEGKLRGELMQMCQKLHLANRVEFPGNTLRMDKVLADAKCFVLSSDYEGLPNALMEAMAAGVPVISTDCPCGGPRALITSQNEGILLPCADSNLMANAMRLLLNDKSLQNRLSAAAHKRAQSFAPDVIFSQWDTYLFTPN